MDINNPIGLVALSGLIALVPLVIALGTSYVKVSVVLGMLRSALGAQQVPGPIVTMALSIALSVYIMAPVFEQSFEKFDTFPKFSSKRLPSKKELAVLAPAFKPWKEFMVAHSGNRELTLFKTLDSSTEVLEKNNAEELDFKIVAPAFLITELKEAFTMAFVLLIPFLVIDLITANILVGMGMFMVSPVLISLPLKLLLFVLSDGWMLLIRSLVSSYQIGGV